jgi:hypothetical protein
MEQQRSTSTTNNKVVEVNRMEEQTHLNKVTEVNQGGEAPPRMRKVMEIDQTITVQGGAGVALPPKQFVVEEQQYHELQRQHEEGPQHIEEQTTQKKKELPLLPRSEHPHPHPLPHHEGESIERHLQTQLHRQEQLEAHQHATGRTTKFEHQKIIPAERIAVIICGWPNDLALSTAKACVRRGYRMLPFGLALNDSKEDRVDISDIGTIELLKYCDSQAKTRLEEQVRLARLQQLFPMVVDTSEDTANLRRYQELRVPFVFESADQDGDEYHRAVRETEHSRTFALISEKMDKRVAAVDSFWDEWARRFPGLFAESASQEKQQNEDSAFQFACKVSDEKDFAANKNKRLFDSVSDLLNRDITSEDDEEQGRRSFIQQIGSTEEKEQHGMMHQYETKQEHINREYTLKNSSGSAVFKFQQSVNGKYECAEGIADSVNFLAQRCQEMARPRVFHILDVAQQSRYLTW